jgi:two-component system chemotaxis sensor kinase CheA
MDVVRRNVEALSGAVSLSSVPGYGTTVELRIPLTLAIVEGLLAEAGGQLFLIKLEYIRECVDVTQSQGRSTGNILDFRGAVVPLLDLARFFGVESDSASRKERAIIVVDAGDQRVGLIVDRLLGNHQSVVKSLGRLLAGIDGISGAIFLSDGTPALMLDVERVVGHARGLH